MKYFLILPFLSFLVSCGGGASSQTTNPTPSDIWTKPQASEGFLMEASSFKSSNDLNSYMPNSSSLYAHWNPQSGALKPSIKFMMFGTPNSLCPSNTQGDLLAFDDNTLINLGLDPSHIPNDLRFEPKPMSNCSYGANNLHGPNFTFLDGFNIWMKTQSSNNSSDLLKTFDSTGQNNTGANTNIIGNFTSFRFPFSFPEPANSIKPFAKNNTARISLSTSVKTLDTGNSNGITQPKQQIMATFANPDCYNQKLSLCQINILIDIAIARNGVTNWNDQSWSLKSRVSLDPAQNNLPIWESFLPENGQSIYFKDINEVALTSRGSPTIHSSFDTQLFNAEISFDSFKTALRIASAKILNKNISTDNDCLDCQQVFGTYWNNVNHWILLDSSVGQEIYDDSGSNGIILSSFDWLFVGSAPV